MSDIFTSKADELIIDQVLQYGLCVSKAPKYTVLRVKKRAKLSRALGKRALKSFHPRLFNDRFLTGASWSVRNGPYCRTQTASSCR